MPADKIDRFNEKAIPIFRATLEKYGYLLEEEQTRYVNGQKWVARHIYVNNQAKLKIMIEQAPYYTDYGFTFDISNLGTCEYNILYNVPHEIQDEGDLFLNVAYDELFSTLLTLDLIRGSSWKKLGYIPFQKK